MHYALPQRKTAHPAPYEVKPRRPLRQNRALRLVIFVVGAFAFLILLYRLFSWSSRTDKVFNKAPYGYPNVVVVTTIDPVIERADPQFIESIKANRIEYAAKHGYKTFFPYSEEYRSKLENSPTTWARVPAMRNAMANYTNTPYFFHVDHKTLIMNMDLSIEDHIMDKKKLEGNMLTDVPVIPPDSIIKTFSGVSGDGINMVISQDKDGLMPNAFVMRQGHWSKFMLDVWFDPMYQRYNFQKAERHALEHIIQWHGTILAHIALLPQKILTTYTEKDAKLASDDGLYKEGDFTVYFGDCDRGARSCTTEMKPYFATLFAKEKSDSQV